jgi:CRP/FNR family cyclic AMP-dependent transcriptional regulator
MRTIATPGKAKNKHSPAINVQAFLDSSGLARSIQEYRKSAKIYSPGESSKHVMYIQKGAIKLSVFNEVGKEAVVAMLGAGDFFGEGGLAGQVVRLGTATALAHTTLLAIDRKEMIRKLHAEHAFSERFVANMLARNIRIEEDLIDQLFNGSEKRLARTLLLLLVQCDTEDELQPILVKISQGTLAGMIGTPRTRVNFFMNKFKRLGFIKNDGGLKIIASLLRSVLKD